ncbi:MAG: inositol-3-phosphate synthase, partial [Actinobacteria bacterium]|nr:inositol-3-phosphate synthase [Actinomycetota bacterium]
MSKEDKGEIRVAIIGVGNCANSLVQGITYYKDATNETEIPGLMHPVLGGYHIKNINFVLALDVDAKKVGLDLADAIWASENNTIKFANVAKTGVTVKRGTTLDGLGRYYKETISESTVAPVDVVAELKNNKVEVVICYLPVGSEEAAKYYAQCAIDAGCAFVNALPVFIAS